MSRARRSPTRTSMKPPGKLELKKTKDETSVSATGPAVFVCGAFGIVALLVYAYIQTHG